jgi:hypothetical protein
MGATGSALPLHLQVRCLPMLSLKKISNRASPRSAMLRTQCLAILYSAALQQRIEVSACDAAIRRSN